MRRELANSRLKAKIQIKQIGGFTKSLSEKFKSNKLVDLRNLYPNMVVFGLELLIFFEADSEYELENIDFQNF